MGIEYWITNDDFMTKISQFKIRSVDCNFRSKSANIISLLSQKSVRNSLKHFKCYNRTSEKCLPILSLLRQCKKLETGYISYVGELTQLQCVKISKTKRKILHSWENIKSIRVENISKKNKGRSYLEFIH